MDECRKECLKNHGFILHHVLSQFGDPELGQIVKFNYKKLRLWRTDLKKIEIKDVQEEDRKDLSFNYPSGLTHAKKVSVQQVANIQLIDDQFKQLVKFKKGVYGVIVSLIFAEQLYGDMVIQSKNVIGYTLRIFTVRKGLCSSHYTISKGSDLR